MRSTAVAGVAAGVGPQSAEVEPAAVRAAIDDILKSSEFASGESFFDRVRAWIVELLESLLPKGTISPAALESLAVALVWIVLAVIVAFVAWGIVRTLRGRRADGPAEEDAGAPPTVDRARRVGELRDLARAANARGEHVLALRLEFTALVVGLGERGDLEYRDAFTNRELLERGRPRREFDALLRPIVPELDRKSFGGEPATGADFERLSSLSDRLLSGARA